MDPLMILAISLPIYIILGLGLNALALRMTHDDQLDFWFVALWPLMIVVAIFALIFFVCWDILRKLSGNRLPELL